MLAEFDSAQVKAALGMLTWVRICCIPKSSVVNFARISPSAYFLAEQVIRPRCVTVGVFFFARKGNDIAPASALCKPALITGCRTKDARVLSGGVFTPSASARVS